MTKIATVSSLALFALLIFGCKKGNDSKYIKEEFENFYALQSRNWVITNNSDPSGVAAWLPGYYGTDKSGQPYGFPAYSYKKEKTEYLYVGFAGYSGVQGVQVSSWVISPEVEITNNSSVSFYIHGTNWTGDKLEVRMNETDNSAYVGTTPQDVGKFTKLLKEITAPAMMWSRVDIKFSDLTASKLSRIAFRYVPDVSASKGLGIDVFEFKSK